jgi:hypothetical protein
MCYVSKCPAPNKNEGRNRRKKEEICIIHNIKYEVQEDL